MLHYVLVAIAIVLLVLYFTVSSKHKYFSIRGVPQTKPLFFYGDYKAVVLGEKHNGIVTKEIYDANKHLPYVGYYMLNTPVVLINDPELVKDVLIKDFAHFADNNVQFDPSDPFFYFNAFPAKGELWKALRGFLTPIMTSSKIKTIFATNLDRKAKNVVEYLQEQCNKSPVPDTDVKEVASNFTTDVITASAIGVDVNSFKEPESTFRQITRSIFVPSFLFNYVMLLPLVFPFFGRFIRFRFTKDDQINAVKAVTKDAMEQSSKQNHSSNNLISHLLALRESNTELVTDIFIASQVWGFFVNAFETSSTAIMYALFELGLNLDIQDKLRKEIDESCEANNGNICYEELISLKYLDMVISESLRMHSPVTTMERVCTKSYTFPPAAPGTKPLHLEPGMPVVIPVQGIHMDERFYPEPHKFNPENFTNEAIASRPKCTFLAFGEGPRICLGLRLGLSQVKVAVATIVRSFEIRTPSSCEEMGSSFDVKCYVKTPIKPIMLKFYNR